MALLWVDGFDWIDHDVTGTSLWSILTKRYGYADMTIGNDAISRPGAHGHGTAIACRDYRQYIETPALLPSEAAETWIVGWRVRGFGVMPGNGQTFMYLLNDARQDRGRLYNTTIGNLTYSYNLSPSLINHWHWSFYLEVKVYVANSPDGFIEVRVNGEPFWLKENIDTMLYLGLIDRVRLYSWGPSGVGTGEGTYLDDIYICQGTGIDFLGPVRVLHLVPNSDGDDEQWELSGGSDSFALVDEDEPVDDDTEYIHDSVSGQRTLFTYEDAPSGMGDNIKGVQLSTSPRVDNGALDLVQQVKSGGTLYPRVAQNISSGTFTQIQDLMETDPDTGLAWTEAGLNAAQFGVEVD